MWGVLLLHSDTVAVDGGCGTSTDPVMERHRHRG